MCISKKLSRVCALGTCVAFMLVARVFYTVCILVVYAWSNHLVR